MTLDRLESKQMCPWKADMADMSGAEEQPGWLTAMDCKDLPHLDG
jgi:hypothetical protein